MEIFQAIHKCLEYKYFEDYPHFSKDGAGKGRIGTTGFILGLVGGFHLSCLLFSVGLLLLPAGDNYDTILHVLVVWSSYMFFLCLFHFLEFFSTAVCQPGSLTCDSFVVNHSLQYTVAALFSWLEFWAEAAVFGGRQKILLPVAAVGLVAVLGGQCMRTLAMWQCGRNFSHRIVERKPFDQQLVKDGVYRIFRHPSYFGWFYWSIGTQLLLCNPLCTVAYTVAAWTFFKERIPYEEALLRKFFPVEYDAYIQSTVIGIPFI